MSRHTVALNHAQQAIKILKEHNGKNASIAAALYNAATECEYLCLIFDAADYINEAIKLCTNGTDCAALKERCEKSKAILQLKLLGY